MCGIAGIVEPGKTLHGRLKAMTDALSHRGPDGEGSWYHEGVALGHRRLSIIDVAGSPQPMSIDDGALWMTFNGEIYNYTELRDDLKNSVTFSTDGDTEVVLQLYKLYGKNCLQYLRGMFSFAIYDTRDGTLFAARDHLGQKPFYYTQQGTRLMFASEIKALLAADSSLREMDEAALHEYLTLRIITPPRSMFKRVRKLPPGHYLTFQHGKLHVERYWDLQFTPKSNISFPDAAAELESKIDEAVKYNLVADVPAGAFLSGGMDSSLIAHMMARHLPEGFDTFSGEIPYEGYSELPFARLVAEQINARAHEISIEPSLVKGLPDLLWHLDEPSDPLSVCMYHISQLASQSVKVVLGGDGGDELFGGYDRYFGNQYASWYALLPQVVRHKLLAPVIRRLSTGGWYRSMGHQLRWMQQMSDYPTGIRYGKSLSYFYFSDQHRASLYTDSFAKRTTVFDPEAHIAQHFLAANADDLLDRMLYADSNTRMVDHPVMILDRMSMAHGVEARSPFLDHKLAEYCAQLPSRFKIARRKLRVIQKHLVGKLLPAPLLTRSKQGFSSPLPYVLAGEFDQLYSRLLRGAHLVRDGVLRQEAVDQLVDDHLGGRADHGQRLWQIVNAESWYRMHIEGDDRDQLRDTITQQAA